MIFSTLYQKVTKIKNKCFKNEQTQFLLDRTKVSIFLKTVQIMVIGFEIKDFLDLLIVQFTLHTLYTTQKHKIQFPNLIDPLCIEIVEGFYN